MQQHKTGVFLIKLIIQSTYARWYIICKTYFFLVVAAILLAVSGFSLITFLKDRKKTKQAFNKRKW
ncbi:small membrane protein [Klebsiella pneumoniae]|uniref:Small membrane protein n=1 Tax=Klebsiella pneumoniae TaxID=573 RepID=A0A5C2LNS1_KLEPN|nr:small membrane protein [Klebsiella pneumoniae]